MNILVLSNLFPPYSVGGYEVACEAFVRRFAHDRVTILTTSYGLSRPIVEGDVARVFPNVFGAWPDGEVDLPSGWRRFFEPRVYGTTRGWIRKVEPDICYVWNLYGLSLAPVVAARAYSIPVVYHFEDNWLPDIDYHPHAAVERTKRVIGAPFTFHGRTGAIFVSDFLRHSYEGQGFSFSRSTVIYNGVAGAVAPRALDNDLASSRTPVRLLFMGRIVPEKGVETLIEALGLAQRLAPGCLSLSIAGFGLAPYTEELEQRAARDGLPVRWLGRLDRACASAAYREHDVAVVPSSWEEPFGLVALEAMAAGLPVVATRSGGLTEIVRHGVNGLLVPRNDPRALTEALMELVRDPVLRARLGRQALGDVRERFEMDRQAHLARKFLDVVAGS